MAKLIIVGNGFDLAHKIPTSYNDFRKYLIDNYPVAFQNRYKLTEINKIKDLNMLSVELLLYAMDNVNGEDWSNFESSLSVINFKDKFFRHKHRDDAFEDQRTAMEYLIQISEIVSIFNVCVQKWGDLLSDWIRIIERHIESNKFKPIQEIEELLVGDTMVMTFNYTKTIEMLYDKRGVKHIHNRIGQNLIFGHSEVSPMYKENIFDGGLMASDLDDILKSLYKDTDRQKYKYRNFFNKIDNNINEIYSYGFNYSKSDITYIKLILKSISVNSIWYFTKFDSKNKNFIRIIKIKLRKLGFKGSFGIF